MMAKLVKIMLGQSIWAIDDGNSQQAIELSIVIDKLGTPKTMVMKKIGNHKLDL
jgi:hypothetical protein